MAAFRIHEDVYNYNPQRNKVINNKVIKGHVLKSQNITKIPTKRVPLKAANTINNQKRDPVTVKLCARKTIENERNVINVEVISNSSEESTIISSISDEKENSRISINSIELFDHISGKSEIEQDTSSPTHNHERFYFPRDQQYLTTVEYHESIFKYLMYTEREIRQPKPDYMLKQPDINPKMRSVLVDWLSQVSEEYNLQPQTLHLTIQYIDCFLSRMSVVKSKFQLVGTAAMMIAAKYEEIYPPDTKEWIYLSAESFNMKQLLKMEQLILKVLQFEVARPTAYSFINHICFVCDIPKKYMLLAMYFSELALLEGTDYFNYLPSQIASSSLALARYTLHEPDLWPPKLAHTTGYTFDELSVLMQRQNKTFEDSPTKPQQAIQEKYRTSKYGKISLCTPRSLDLYMEE